MKSRWFPWPLALAALAIASTWLLTAPASGAQLVGSATYRERIGLSPDAVFEAVLEDVSRADAPARVVARARKPNPGQVPIQFEIAYEPRDLDARRRYAVRASVVEGGRLRFSGSQPYVVNDARGWFVVVMQAVAAEGASADPGRERRQGVAALGELPATYTGLLPCPDCMGVRHRIDLLPFGAYMRSITHLRAGRDETSYAIGTWWLSRGTLRLQDDREGNAWVVEDRSRLRLQVREGQPVDARTQRDLRRRSGLAPLEPRARLSGLFRYQADAAQFRDCRSGLRWPVATSGDYLALERAYGAQRRAPGAELLVSLDARIEHRPRVEGTGTEPTLVVERFLRAMPGETCPGHETSDGLGTTRWRPVRIGERAVMVSAGEREPWIELDPHTMRVTGSGGCNRISGSYESGEGLLRFGPLIATKIACPALETETAFLRALSQTRGYRVRGRVLDLLDDRGLLVARLEERNPR